MKFLLTGAAGFIGAQLLTKLKAQGFFIRALARSSHTSLGQADEVVIEHLTAHSDFKRLLANIDCVIHLADGFNAYEHLPIGTINSQAAKRLLTSIALANHTAKNGVDFIYLSTIKTMCGTHADQILDEASPTRPQSLYGDLKRKTEQAILGASLEHQTKAVILRFPIVFGPGVGGNMKKLLRLVDTPLPLPLRGLDARRSPISSHSLIQAVMAIVLQKPGHTGLYLVQDGAISTQDMVKTIRQGLGRPANQFAAPTILWKALETLPFLRQSTIRLTHPLELNDHHFRTRFNWQPKKPLPDFLLEWAQQTSPGKQTK